MLTTNQVLFIAQVSVIPYNKLWKYQGTNGYITQI